MSTIYDVDDAELLAPLEDALAVIGPDRKVRDLTAAELAQLMRLVVDEELTSVRDNLARVLAVAEAVADTADKVTHMVESGGIGGLIGGLFRRG